jgi:DNA-binding response OmpR family regulator
VAPSSDTPPAGGPSRGRVLVVEDDAHIRDLVVLHLQLEGLTPVAAGDGATGLRLAKADPFDLLILDVMLPQLDGVTVCRAVRRESMNGDVPILMLTAHEFDLLYLLATNRGIVFSRDALMQKVWGDDTHITERSVDTLVKRVRRKIEEDPAEPEFVLTVWGTGYKFADV